MRRLTVEGGVLGSLTFSRDGKTLAGVSSGGSAIQLLDMATGKERTTPSGHRVAIEEAILTPDGRTAVTASLEGSILIWDAATGNVKNRLDGHKIPSSRSNSRRTDGPCFPAEGTRPYVSGTWRPERAAANTRGPRPRRLLDGRACRVP